MKKKILLMILAVVLPATVTAGEAKTPVVTKDEPEKCAGYYSGQYHLKCKNEKTANEGYVERKHQWQNPFSGFTNTSASDKPKKQGSMPHAR